MDNSILKKKLSTFKTKGGFLKNVSEELLLEILAAWESWEGTLKSFYSSIGTSPRQMAFLLGKAKKLKREGAIVDSEFKEIKLPPSSNQLKASPIILKWDKKRLIKFYQVDHLVEFLKKVS
jgi:hypothetical protein